MTLVVVLRCALIPTYGTTYTGSVLDLVTIYVRCYSFPHDAHGRCNRLRFCYVNGPSPVVVPVDLIDRADYG